MFILGADIGLGEFFLKQFVVPSLICLAVIMPIAIVAKALRPKLARLWLQSRLRARYCTVSKANLCAFITVNGNLFVLLMLLPLLRVPPGSGIKPMGLVFFSLVINVVAPVMCQRVVQGTDRPQGSRLILGIAILLCLTPFLGGMFLMHLIAAFRDLQFG